MFYFKGISSKEMGLVVEKQIKIDKPAKQFEKIDVEGRSGYYVIDKGTYSTIIVSVQCHFKTKPTDELYSWLDGYGKFSLDDEVEWDAIVNNNVALNKITEHFDKIVIQFELQPIRREKTIYEIPIATDNETIEIAEATMLMNPIIEIDMVGDIDITINNKTFQLKGLNGMTTLDSETKTIFDATGNISNKMLGNFPALTPKTNSINYLLGDGAVLTSFNIKYQKTFI